MSTEQRKASRRAASKKRNDARIAAGLCLCGERAIDGARRCQGCIEIGKIKAEAKREEEARRAQS